MRKHMLTGATLVCLIWAQAATGGGQPGDKDFLAKAIAAQIAEIKLGEMALDKAGSADVKAFAREMVQDHTKMRDALMDCAKSRKLAVVQGLEKEYKDKAEQLSKLSGAQFDREYMKCMVEDHQKALREFRAQAKSAQGADLRELLTKSIPTVEQHLKHAQRIAENLK